MAVNVSERRKEIGVLRAIGATRRTVVASFVVMCFIIGFFGAVLGLPLGKLLAHGLVGAVSRSASLNYATPIDVSSLHFSAEIVALALVGGVVAALVGGIVPAYRASGVACAEALRPKDVDVTPPLDLRAVALRMLGLFILAYVALESTFHVELRVPSLRGSTLPIAFFGGALIAPWLTSLAIRAMRRLVEATPLARVSTLKLALASLSSTARRASGGTTLSAALVLVLITTTTHASMKSTLSSATERTLAADVWISEKGMFLTGDSEAMREDVGREIDAIPGVDTARYGGVHALRTTKLRYDGRSILLKAWDRPPKERAPIVMLDGEDGRDALFASTATSPVVLVSENFALHFGKRRGDSVLLDTPSGKVAFRVAGVMLDFGSPEGTIYMSRETYKALWKDALVSVFYAYASPGHSPAIVRDRIDATVGRRYGLVTNVTADVRSLSQEVLDDAWAYTRAIEVVALFVGLLGLVSTVLVSVLERKRELGMLRAIGMSPRQLSTMIALEMGCLGIASATVALVVGGYLAQVWLASSFARDVGWPISVHVPIIAVVGTLAAGAIVGIIAGVLGAERARRVELGLALAYE
jgi:putative ABC transport system permease protein